MLENCKVLSNHVVVIKLSEVILFPYILGGSQKKVRSLKALYTLPPGRPVHSDTNSAALGSILAMQQLRGMTNHTHFQHWKRQVLIYTAEWTEASSLCRNQQLVSVASHKNTQWTRDSEWRKCPNLKTKGGFKPGLSRL